ncbi:hypothetical protein VCR14J2_300306 [Vibrio coralliirubri]|nr:hypothetical protein VCR14J2_300306 [Vibrio coralliirubri]
MLYGFFFGMFFYKELDYKKVVMIITFIPAISLFLPELLS